MNYDRAKRDVVQRLSLNVDDNVFFFRRVLLRPDDDERLEAPNTNRPSHQLIHQAAQMAAERLEAIEKGYADPHAQAEKWVQYFTESAVVIVRESRAHYSSKPRFRMVTP